MSDCIFCKLANGEIPTATLYEDDEFRVILDAGPATKGHCLILPKAHYADIYEIPDDLLGRAFQLAKKIAVRMSLPGWENVTAVKNQAVNYINNDSVMTDELERAEGMMIGRVPLNFVKARPASRVP